MKKAILITLFAVLFISCGNGKGDNNKVAADTNVQEQTVSDADNSIVNVYYFHGKQRCKTCIAIENVTKNTIADNYKDNPQVRFIEINIDEDKNKDIVEKYEIAFSSLLIAKGDNSVDITEQAFAQAVNSPATLADLIKEEVNQRIDK